MFKKSRNKQPDITAKNKKLGKDDIASLLECSQEALRVFEETHKIAVLDFPEKNDFTRTSPEQTPEGTKQEEHQPEALERSQQIADKIVYELLRKTTVFHYDRHTCTYSGSPAPYSDYEPNPVTGKEILNLPRTIRPDFTGNMARTRFKINSSGVLAWNWKKYLRERDPEKKKMFYNLFRQGLDVLDIDPVTYAMIETNPNSMSHWFPALVEACAGQDFFKIPETTIAKLPMTLLQLTRLDYMGLTQSTLDIVDEWASEAFNLNPDGDYFIKTGTYANKFDFSSAHVDSPKGVSKLGESLLFTHSQACQMADPAMQPVSIYGASTTAEWVVREFIHDKEENPEIYNGLPLHTEFRLFVDTDAKRTLGIFPCWDPETMEDHFAQGTDNSTGNRHDYEIYKAHESTLMGRYWANVDAVKEMFEEKVLPNLDLRGQWSVDIMMNGGDFWIIDMAVAETCSFYEDVPDEFKRNSKENWMPVIAEPDAFECPAPDEESGEETRNAAQQKVHGSAAVTQPEEPVPELPTGSEMRKPAPEETCAEYTEWEANDPAATAPIKDEPAKAESPSSPYREAPQGSAGEGIAADEEGSGLEDILKEIRDIEESCWRFIMSDDLDAEDNATAHVEAENTGADTLPDGEPVFCPDDCINAEGSTEGPGEETTTEEPEECEDTQGPEEAEKCGAEEEAVDVGKRRFLRRKNSAARSRRER